MYFHNHSQFSSLDGIPVIENMVDRAVQLGYPALAVTDHGNMAGWVQLYKAAKQYDILPFPGFEGYLVDPEFEGTSYVLDSKEGKDTERFHITLIGLDKEGFQQLRWLTSLSHTRPRFHRFPRFTLSDLLSIAGPHVAILTGCLSGYFQKSLLRGNEKEAIGFVKTLAAKFPNTYVELMDHNIPENVLVEIAKDDKPSRFANEQGLMRHSFDIAQKIGLPVIASQDSHYLVEEDIIAHAMMKKITFGEGETFSGDSYHMASKEWVSEHYPGHIWQEVEVGLKDLVSKNQVTFPPLDNFQIHVPKIKDNAQAVLTKLVFNKIQEMGLSIEHEAVAADELNVIGIKDLANYILDVYEIIQWCEDNNIMVEARGSANSSVVCYALGITQVDPIEWDIKFERFLSLDRVKPPDIDLDIEDIYHDKVIEYVKAKHPGAVRVGTWGMLGESKNGQGSVMVSWTSKMRDNCEKEARAEGLKGVKADVRKNEIFQKKYGHIKKVDDIRRFFPEDYPGLERLLISNSVQKGYGTTGGGIVISGDDLKIDEWVPTMLVGSSDTIVTQWDKDDLAELGILKHDLLSQASLTLLKGCQVLMGRKNPRDLKWITNDDVNACKEIRTGRTNSGIFHAEGWTKARGFKELYPNTTAEIAIGSALFMPGADSQRDLYIARKNDPRLRKTIRYIHPVFEKNLAPTYGCVVYQDQVINIMRDLGMTENGVNTFFKIVKSSGRGAVEANKILLKKVQGEFAELCAANGIKEVEEAWKMTAGFAGYGFGKAHSVGYGIRTYRAGYLKAYNPDEYMTEVLNTNKDPKKEPAYVQEVKRMGLKIGLPHVNKSGLTWVLDKENQTIIRPIQSVNRVGPVIAEWIVANQPFDSVDDLCIRSTVRGVTGVKSWLEDEVCLGTIKELRMAGALDGLFASMDREDLEI